LSDRRMYTPTITIDFARTSFAGNFSQPMSEFVAQKIFCDWRWSPYGRPVIKFSVVIITRSLCDIVSTFFFSLQETCLWCRLTVQ
jgi:hypothetical protein